MMGTLEQQVRALMRLCTAQTEAERVKARTELGRLIREETQPATPEAMVRQLLLELGAPDHLSGPEYTVYAILLAAENRTYIHSITFGLYPQVAAHFDTTAGRVERAIRHLVEVTWTRGDVEVLQRYFGNTVSPEKGKPTNGEFIARMANVLRQRLEQAA